MSDITLIPPGKLRCYVTGVLRNDTPEEHVRQRMARSLVEEYGYERESIGIEVRITMGRAKKRADLVVYEQGAPHQSTNIRIIVEAKRDTIKPTHKDCGVEQLKSYISVTPSCAYGLWVGSEVVAFERIEKSNKVVIERVGDIPFADGRDPSQVTFDRLVPATESLKDVFRRCHNYVAANQGGSKESAFHEFLKITFCKVFDERNSATPRFYAGDQEAKQRKGQQRVLERLQELFEDVCEDYGYIFGDEDKIKLKPNVCVYLVKELQKYSLLETEFDYKGQAYEEIVGTNSRGDRGEFFTPRNLCSLAVDILETILGDEKFRRIKILDPACGTGGFLKSYVHRLYEKYLEVELRKRRDAEKARYEAKERLRSTCDRNVFGIDFNPVLVRAAQMNLVMHGDGSSNVFHENSLLSCGEWEEATRASIRDGAFDVILTNPPFGEDLSIDDAHVLSQYELSTIGRSARASIAPQELFVERCWRLLKNEGLLLIVMPDNILSNPSYRRMREWMLKKFDVIASISLPSEMFQPYTGTQTSLLVVRKLPTPFADLTTAKKKMAGSAVFMSVPKRVGHDQRGNVLPLRDESGSIVMREINAKTLIKKRDGSWATEIVSHLEVVPDDHLPQVASDFKKWHQDGS